MVETILLFREALYGALIIGVTCAVLGVYVVLKRIVFVGAALSQLSSAGLALAFWLGGAGLLAPLAEYPVAVSLVVTLLGAAFFGLGGSGRRLISSEATIGVTYAVAAALAILLIAKSPSKEAHDLLFHGNILGITRRDMVVLLAVSVPVLLLHGVFYKEFLFTSFDPETAATQAFSVRRWNLLFYLTLAVVITASMQFGGVLPVFNFLVLPAVTGLLLARTMAGTFFWAVIAAVAAVLIGFSASVRYDHPAGPAIIAAQGGLVGLAWLARRRRA